MIALAVLVLLVAVRNHGAWGYILRTSGAVDGRSLCLWLAYGLWPVLLAAAVWAASLGMGRRLLRALGAPAAGPLDGTAAAALGLGLLGEAVFLMGWSGVLNPAALTALAVAAALAGWSFLPRPGRLPRFEPAAGLLAFGAFHLLIVSLAPPTEWDARAYHLAIPEIYLRSGRFLDIRWLLHSHWPHLMEGLYTLPLAAGRDGAAALIHAGACGLLAFGVFYAAGGGVAGWTGALILAGQPAFLRGAPTPTSDGACALFLFAGAHALSRWEAKPSKGRLIAAGLLAGFAAAAKLFGGAGAACWTVYLIWRTRRLREAAIFAACAGLIVGPWLLRTWIHTGDPLWPLLGLDRASTSLAAGLLRINFWSWPPPDFIWTHRGPQFLAVPLAGLLMIARGRRPPSAIERLLWLAAPLIVVLTLRNNDLWRVLMPAYAAAALACGRCASAAILEGGWRRIAAIALVAFGAAPLSALTQNNELFAVLGLRSTANPGASPRDLFEDRSVDVSSFYREAKSVLPAASRVLLFREIRGYGARFDYMWGDPMNQNAVGYDRLQDFQALHARLKELGVTHVLDHDIPQDPRYYSARTLDLMSGMLKRSAHPVLVRETLVLYQLL